MQEEISIYRSTNNDRLARDPIEHLTIRLTLRELGIPIVISATEKLYDSRNEDISQLLQDGFSKYEVENIKIRTLDGLKNRARNDGYWWKSTIRIPLY
ncbi:recombinase family protein [Anaerobacillus sp. HL2]|nr:recombinase family protein [Anaerobacillus sp. HL2]